MNKILVYPDRRSKLCSPLKSDLIGDVFLLVPLEQPTKLNRSKSFQEEKSSGFATMRDSTAESFSAARARDAFGMRFNTLQRSDVIECNKSCCELSFAEAMKVVGCVAFKLGSLRQIDPSTG